MSETEGCPPIPPGWRFKERQNTPNGDWCVYEKISNPSQTQSFPCEIDP